MRSVFLETREIVHEDDLKLSLLGRCSEGVQAGAIGEGSRSGLISVNMLVGPSNPRSEARRRQLATWSAMLSGRWFSELYRA